MEQQVKTFWELWTQDLKVSFPKKEVIDQLVIRWNITERNVRERLAKEKFPETSKDISWLYENYGIALDVKNGFFFDEKKADEIKKNRFAAEAQLFGMSK